jgi:anti-sigma regulatory factor (Ser/Thr protein kinase)
MALGRHSAMLVTSDGLAVQPRPDVEAASERDRLRARVRDVIVPGLEQLDDPHARPADLIARADKQALRLRAELERDEPQGPPADAATAQARDECEWVRGHLHDTALQILEFIAGDGFGTGLSAAKISHLAGGAARDLRTWIERADTRAAGQLLPELQQVAEEARSLNRTVRLDINAFGEPLSAEHVAAITGAVREAVNNARKHAHARQVVISVDSDQDGRTAVTVTDDGIGIDAERVAGGSGLGLSHSIVARMTRVGGHASLEDAPGGGTLVKLLAPRRDGRA